MEAGRRLPRQKHGILRLQSSAEDKYLWACQMEPTSCTEDPLFILQGYKLCMYLFFIIININTVIFYLGAPTERFFFPCPFSRVRAVPDFHPPTRCALHEVKTSLLHLLTLQAFTTTPSHHWHAMATKLVHLHFSIHHRGQVARNAAS